MPIPGRSFVGLIFGGDQRQYHVFPLFLLQKIRRQIALMHPVRDHQHAASLAVVEPRHQHRGEELDGAFYLFKFIGNVVRIVDDDDVSSTAGNTAVKIH